MGSEYVSVLALYLPELIVGGFSAVFLVAAWVGRAWAVLGLALVAILTPFLGLILGSPTHGAWVLTSLLLGATALHLRVLKRQGIA